MRNNRVKRFIEILGVEETLEFTNTIKVWVEAGIEDLQESTLTEKQEELLLKAIAAYEAKDYEQALVSIWSISN